MIEKPKAILFDWDNTLADTWPTIHEALTHTFVTMGKEPWTFEQTKEKVHRSLRDSFPEIFHDKWEEAGQLYLDYFESVHIERLTPIKHAKEMLDALKETGIYTAVVSNKTGYNLRSEISHLGWGHYFAKQIGAKDAKNDKPHPDPIYLALEGSGIEPNKDVWLIGDSLTDLECAYNAKCKPVFYGDQDLTDARFAHVQPDLHISDHQQLHQIIKDLV
tara:strand:+ start:1132 stop:1785 length:654 start_codon:yes stop_codon:yes gene_type:complete